MYLLVTEQVRAHVSADFFANSSFMKRLDVVFANFYFDALSAASRPCVNVPTAWRPLFSSRRDPEIHEIQFALAGMTVHIRHDLPLALIRTCEENQLDPRRGTVHADYQKVDQILDSIEQSVRESFESGQILTDDKDHAALFDRLGSWSIIDSRDQAWETAMHLWECRHVALAEHVLLEALAHTVAAASDALLHA